jgi:hypothetical protein
MHRVARLSTVVGVVVLCVACVAVTVIATAENVSDVIVSQLPQPHAETMGLSPGPLPSRRGLTPEVGATAASTIEQAFEQCVEADMQAIGAPGAAVTVMLDGDNVLDPLFDLTFISRGASGGITRWLRNRSFVGKRVVPPRHPSGRRAPQ